MRLPRYPDRPHKSGQARITIRGRCHYLGVWGSPESHAEYARLIAELTAGGGPAPAPTHAITIAELILRWDDAAEKERGPDSKELKQFRHALTVLTRLFGSLKADQFTTNELRKVRDAMVTGSWMNAKELAYNQSHRLPVGWCRKVCNRQITRIRTVWRWAEDQGGLVPKGSWEHLRALRQIPKTDKRVRQTADRRPATWEQVQAAIGVVPLAVAVMLELQWWSGMRPGEVVRMRAGDLREDGPDGTWLYRLDAHKNDWREGRTEDDVTLGPECQRVLRPWLDAARARGPDAYLFPPASRGVGHYREEAYTRCVARACARHGIPHFSPYQIRHAAKQRVTRALGLDAARAQLRQKSIGATDGYARQRDLDLAAEAARKTG